MTALRVHHVLWTAPAPLWGRFGTAPKSPDAFLADDQAHPAILRFATDEFMDEMLATLAADPRRIGALIARPETWRDQTPGAPKPVEPIPAPRFARSLARRRKDAAPSSSVERTVSELPAKENGVDRTRTLKLYHPAHQRHYLVAANLVCRQTGFPDRAAAGAGEQTAFVLRRLLPDTAGALEEFGFVKDAAGPHWQRVVPSPNAADPAGALVAGEELLPLFPLNFRDETSHPRRLLAGLVPVGRREEYMGVRAERVAPAPGAVPVTGAGGGPPDPTPISARKEQFKLEVAEPWKNIVRTAFAASARIQDVTAGAKPGADPRLASALNANQQLQGQSWLVLLDFADYLAHHVTPVWNCIADPASDGTRLPTATQRRLFTWLNRTPNVANTDWAGAAGTPAFAVNLRDALARIRTDAVRNGLERAVRSFPDAPGDGLAWPGFRFLLAGVLGSGYAAAGIHQTLQPLPDADLAPLAEDQVVTEPATPSPMQVAEAQAAILDKLVQLVVTAIDTTAPAKATPPLPFAVHLRDALKTTAGDPGWFVMRCVYVRRECGPLHAHVLSPPTQRFQLAGFFDPDAPARPIRISLPMDTTPAGMRKFNKNTAFVMSDVLCGQVQRAKGLGLVDLVLSVLPWPLHKDLDVGGMGPCKSGGNSMGMICSLSIPIITICALILLMIMVTILDFIFKWMPWFIVCFPVPNALKAKAAQP